MTRLLGLKNMQTERLQEINPYSNFRCIPMNNGEDLRAVVSVSKNEVERNKHFMSRLDGMYPFQEMSINNYHLLVSANPEHFRLYREPRESNSKKHGSTALYLGRSYDEKEIVQLLPEWANGSFHWHDGPEYYYQIYGTALMLKSYDSQSVFDDNKYLKVEAWEHHRVSSFNQVSFSFLRCDFGRHIYP